MGKDTIKAGYYNPRTGMQEFGTVTVDVHAPLQSRSISITDAVRALDVRTQVHARRIRQLTLVSLFGGIATLIVAWWH